MVKSMEEMRKLAGDVVASSTEGLGVHMAARDAYVTACSPAQIIHFCDLIEAQAKEIEGLREGLRDIDAMPLYPEPVAPEHVEGLRKRYQRAMAIVAALLSPSDSGRG